MAVGCKIIADTHSQTSKNIAKWSTGWGSMAFDMLVMVTDIMKAMAGTESSEARSAMFNGASSRLKTLMGIDEDDYNSKDPYMFIHMKDELRDLELQLSNRRLKIDCFPRCKINTIERTLFVQIMISPTDDDFVPTAKDATPEQHVNLNLKHLEEMLSDQFVTLAKQATLGLLRTSPELRFYIPSCLMDDLQEIAVSGGERPVSPRELLFDLFQKLATYFGFSLLLYFTTMNGQRGTQSDVAPEARIIDPNPKSESYRSDIIAIRSKYQLEEKQDD